MVTVGLKVAMLFLCRRLISAGQLSIGSVLAFVLFQKDMVTNMKVSKQMNHQQAFEFSGHFSGIPDVKLTEIFSLLLSASCLCLWRHAVHCRGGSQGVHVSGQKVRSERSRRAGSCKASGETCFPQCQLLLSLTPKYTRTEGKHPFIGHELL